MVLQHDAAPETYKFAEGKNPALRVDLFAQKNIFYPVSTSVEIFLGKKQFDGYMHLQHLQELVQLTSEAAQRGGWLEAKSYIRMDGDAETTLRQILNIYMVKSFDLFSITDKTKIFKKLISGKFQDLVANRFDVWAENRNIYCGVSRDISKLYDPARLQYAIDIVYGLREITSSDIVFENVSVGLTQQKSIMVAVPFIAQDAEKQEAEEPYGSDYDYLATVVDNNSPKHHKNGKISFKDDDVIELDF